MRRLTILALLVGLTACATGDNTVDIRGVSDLGAGQFLAVYQANIMVSGGSSQVRDIADAYCARRLGGEVTVLELGATGPDIVIRTHSIRFRCGRTATPEESRALHRDRTAAGMQE